MDERDYYLEYRCRRCGEMFTGNRCGSDRQDPLRDLALSVFWTMAHPQIISPHRCKDGGVGIVELVGMKSYDQPPNHFSNQLDLIRSEDWWKIMNDAAWRRQRR